MVAWVARGLGKSHGEAEGSMALKRCELIRIPLRLDRIAVTHPNFVASRAFSGHGTGAGLGLRNRPGIVA